MSAYAFIIFPQLHQCLLLPYAQFIALSASRRVKGRAVSPPPAPSSDHGLVVSSKMAQTLLTGSRSSGIDQSFEVLVEVPVSGSPPAPLAARPSSPHSISGSGSASCLNSQSTPLLIILPSQIWEEALWRHAFHLIIAHR